MDRLTKKVLQLISDASFEKLLSVTNIIFNDQEVVLDIEQNDDDGSSRIEKC